MTTTTEAANQLRDELLHRLDALASLVACTDEPLWLGDVQDALPSLEGAAAPLVERLFPRPADVDEDEEDFTALLAVRTAEAIVVALWPEAIPPASWWATPLGALVARWYAPVGDDGVSVIVAAAMLGRTRGRVYQLLDDGKLDRHPEGGVTRVSVAHRLAAQDEMAPGTDR